MKCTGGTARRPKGGDHFACIAHEREHLVVPTIGEIEESLLRVAREGEIADRSVRRGVRLDDELLHERAVAVEYLDAVVEPVADVDEPVPRQPDAVHGVAELLRRRTGRRGRATRGDFLLVARRLPIRAPMSFVGSRVRIEDDDAAVLVPPGGANPLRLRVAFPPPGLSPPRGGAG